MLLSFKVTGKMWFLDKSQDLDLMKDVFTLCVVFFFTVTLILTRPFIAYFYLKAFNDKRLPWKDTRSDALKFAQWFYKKTHLIAPYLKKNFSTSWS